jgi:1-deoxy-D-xylulose-5-phosphate synthase
MALLDSVSSPRDLDGMSLETLDELAQEIRDFLINKVSRTGGHLGPNLGVVELTIALHRVFDSPRDPLIWDTGHQSYVHKILTGRQDFSGLRAQGGLAGYPQRSESEHDIVESSHASSSLSWAEGISRAFQMTGQDDRYVVAVVGDGALTGGMTWEALNNISHDNARNLILVVNDNGRSYAPTIGGVARFLAGVRARGSYRFFKSSAEGFFGMFGAPGKALYRGIRGGTRGFLSYFANNDDLYSNLDIKYVGPVDGHNIEDVERALRQAKARNAPVIVHVITEKGRGYAPARNDEADQFHAVGHIDPITGEARESSDTPSWTSVFADEMVAIADRRDDVVGITAAMLRPTGLYRMAQKYPNRVVDQVLMDVALHKAGVTFVLDRAGVTGPDGPSHHGMWDLSLLQIVPHIRIAAPRDAKRLREELNEAISIEDAPTVIRFPKGSVSPELEASRRTDDGVDVLADASHHDVLIVAVGPMAALAMEVRSRLADQGIGATVVDPRWVAPVARSIVEMARSHRIVVSIEDGIRIGGVGTRIRQELRAAGVDTAVDEIGLPDEFIDHASREQILEQAGLTPQHIARNLVAQVMGMKVPIARPLPAEGDPMSSSGVVEEENATFD